MMVKMIYGDDDIDVGNDDAACDHDDGDNV